MTFVLQPIGWTDVPTRPTLNYTNLHYEVTMPAPMGSMFFRLTGR